MGRCLDRIRISGAEMQPLPKCHPAGGQLDLPLSTGYRKEGMPRQQWIKIYGARSLVHKVQPTEDWEWDAMYEVEKMNLRGFCSTPRPRTAHSGSASMSPP